MKRDTVASDTVAEQAAPSVIVARFTVKRDTVASRDTVKRGTVAPLDAVEKPAGDTVADWFHRNLAGWAP